MEMKFKWIFRSSINDKLEKVFKSEKDRNELFEDIGEQLILSDISAEIVEELLLKSRKKLKSSFTKNEFLKVLSNEILDIFNSIDSVSPVSGSILPVDKLKLVDKKDNNLKGVILLVGVNGSGKTTTAAKLAFKMKMSGKKVLLCASDTFRAAGSSQLKLWGEKLNVQVVGGDRGNDPGSVVYNAMNSFVNKKFDSIIIDTAGRVQTKDNLMKELGKLTKIIEKFVPEGPSESLLVIDATMGRNTFDQAKKFKEFSGITGIVLTKLDGTAKGGGVLSIVNELGIPVKYICSGENETDIEPFSPYEFVNSFIGN